MSVTDLKIYTLNFLTLTISFTNVEFIIRFTLVLISIFYTLHKWWLMYEKNK